MPEFSKIRLTSRFAEHFEGLPIQAGTAVVLREGMQQLKSLKVFGRNTVVGRLWFDPLTAGSVVVGPGWIVLFVPLRHKGRFLFTGLEAKPSRLFISVSNQGYATLGECRDTIAIGIRAACVSTLFEESGTSVDQLGDIALDLDPKAFARLRRLFDCVSDINRLASDESGGFKLSDADERDLIAGIFAEVLPAVLEGKGEPLKSVDLAVVRAAEQACKMIDHRQASLQELYSAAGVSRTRLWKAFTSIYGLSPSNYLTYWRLNRAREALLNRTAPPGSIKEVAISLGFTNSGRFAKLYKACFNELTSETISRTSVISE